MCFDRDPNPKLVSWQWLHKQLITTTTTSFCTLNAHDKYTVLTQSLIYPFAGEVLFSLHLFTCNNSNGWNSYTLPTKSPIPFILFTTQGTLMDKPSATVQYMEICVSFWVISLSWVIYSPGMRQMQKPKLWVKSLAIFWKKFQILNNIWLQKSNIYLQTHLSAKPINQNEDMMQENNKRLLHLIIIK